MYLGIEQENAIIEYNTLEQGPTKDKIYLKVIYPALNKLVENIIHNRKLYEYGSDNYANTKLDCVSYLTDRLNKYTKEKGKAFSYYNRVAINFLIQNKKKIETQKFNKVKVTDIDDRRNLVNEEYLKEYRDDLQDFCMKWADWGINNIEILFERKRERRIAEAIFNLFKNSHRIDNYNKKALYIQVREQVDVKTHFITEVMTKLKPLQREMYIEFKNSGTRKWKYFLIKEENGEFI